MVGDALFGGTVLNLITAQSGAFASVLREAPGQFLITMAPGANIAPAHVFAYSKDLGAGASALTWTGVVERVSATQIRLRQATKAGLTDGPFALDVSGVQTG
jgi:hypothetical protein